MASASLWVGREKCLLSAHAKHGPSILCIYMIDHDCHLMLHTATHQRRKDCENTQARSLGSRIARPARLILIATRVCRNDFRHSGSAGSCRGYLRMQRRLRARKPQNANPPRHEKASCFGLELVRATCGRSQLPVDFLPGT